MERRPGVLALYTHQRTLFDAMIERHYGTPDKLIPLINEWNELEVIEDREDECGLQQLRDNLLLKCVEKFHLNILINADTECSEDLLNCIENIFRTFIVKYIIFYFIQI